MKTANEELLDALIRHQTYLLRFSGSLRNRVQAILDGTEDEIAMRIRDKLRNSNGLVSGAELRRMETLLDVIDTIRNTAWLDAQKLLFEDLGDLGEREPKFLAGILQTVSPVLIDVRLPASRMLRAIAEDKPFEGALLKDWAAGLAAEDLRRVHGAVQMGMIAGEGSEAIAARVVGTGALRGTDGVMQMTRNQVQAITRTAVQHIANSARDELMQENAELMLAELFVATLDSRTTPICRANDGKTFPVGKGPRPPLHIACRSLRVAVFDGEVLGNRPFKASTTKQLLREFTAGKGIGNISERDALPRGMKGEFDKWSRKRVRELTGVVPRSTSYQTWLKSQSRTFQEDTLGITKSKLFRDGGLTLDKFVAADGSELSLEDLAVKHKEAFKAAGLDPRDYM